MKEEERIRQCGVCNYWFTIPELDGPYCGGPFTYYCKPCKKIIDTYTEGVKKHKEWYDNAMKQMEKDKPKIIRV